MNSVWNNGFKKQKFESLKGEIKTDILIVGGGITGILCGYFLKNAGIDCVIAESNEICGGVTQNTTAKITCQHGPIYDKMINRFGVEIAALYYKAQQKAVRKYESLCENIDCDFEIKNSYVYSLNDRAKIEKEVIALNKIGCNANFKEKLLLPLEAAGAVEIKNQAQFNPLKFLHTIAKELKIYENTKILEVTERGAKTEKGNIKAKKIIVATHFPIIDKHGYYFLKMYQHRSYVLALKNAQNVDGMYVDEAQNGLSFRNYKDLLLLGGGSHRTGKKGGGWKELQHFASIHYPYAKEITRFATQDCKTLDDIPYIGQYSKNTPNLFVASGFNKWGMTNSLVAAEILTDLVNEKDNEFSRVFSPQRSILHPQLAVNGFESVMNLITPTKPRCSHLGCALKYNKQERSWDCSCHGSRFSSDGRVINNPATKDIQL